MHIPHYNQENDWQQIAAFIQANSFGILINTAEGKPVATHIPIELKEKQPGVFVLEGHIAKVNTQWQSFSNGPTLAVFSSPHAYISSSWYEKEKIPTWNYIAVHIYGNIRILEEQELRESLSYMMERYEAASENPVHIDDIGERTLHNNMKAIVGFEMSIDDVQARFKLSQNKKEHDYNSVIDHLRKLEDTGADYIATEMEQRKR